MMLDQSQIPTIEAFANEIRTPLFRMLLDDLMSIYHVQPIFEYSRCSKPGWNMKLRRSGKSLCTIYPEDGFFTVLVVIGKHEKAAFEQQCSTFCHIIQAVYRDTKEGMGQRWLMIPCEDAQVIEDVKRCIALRCPPPLKHKTAGHV